MAVVINYAHTFGGLSSPIPTSYLDDNYDDVSSALASLNTFGNYYVDTGATNAYAITTAVGETLVLSAGLLIQFKASNANTGASTLSINGGPAKSIVNLDGTALAFNQIVGSQITTVQYDGARFVYVGGIAVMAAGGGTYIRFYMGGTHCGTFNPSSYFKASNSGTYIGVTSNYHELNQSANEYIQRVNNSHASDPYGFRMTFSAAAPNNTSNIFAEYVDSSATRAQIRSNGGLANFSANNVNLSSVDAKESFESLDKSWDKIAEIRKSIQAFKYKDATNKEHESSWCVAPMAEDVESHFPEYVVPFSEKDGVVMKGVREQPLIWEILANLIDEVNDLKEENLILKSSIQGR